MPGEEDGRRLTGYSLQSCRHPRFILPCDVAEEFVAGAERHNGEEGPDEAEGGGDVPASEDDAEVLGVPGE